MPGTNASKAMIMGVVIVVLAILGWPILARIARSAVIQAKTQDYVLAARALGAKETAPSLGRLLRARGIDVDVAVDPLAANTVYAAAATGGVWKSTDAGDTWRQVGSPGPFPVYSLTVDPSAAHTIYAGTNGGGVRTSSDGGVTWQSTSLSNGMVLSLALDPAGALYAGTNFAGAQVSLDRGATWAILPAGVDDEHEFGYGVWIDPSNPQTVFAGDDGGPVGPGLVAGWRRDLVCRRTGLHRPRIQGCRV